jgi:hypothetical protein
VLDAIVVAEAQPESVLKTDSRYTLAQSSDIGFILVRAKPAARETVAVRYSVYVRAETNSVQLAAAAGTSLKYECRWRLNAQLLRQFCFQSITRQSACTQTVVNDLPRTESGTTNVEVESLDTCNATGPLINGPVTSFTGELLSRAKVLIEQDLAQDVMPQLKQPGLTVQRVGAPGSPQTSSPQTNSPKSPESGSVRPAPAPPARRPASPPGRG